MVMKTAILVDGYFYRRRAAHLWGRKDAKSRAEELVNYCNAHLENDYLYRVFYYDCPPIKKSIYHPWLKTFVDMEKTDTCCWLTEFLEQLKGKRKFALRQGEMLDAFAHYNLTAEAVKKLLDGSVGIEDLTERDFVLCGIEKKQANVKIGLDIASLAYKKQVDRIILISGDSDFVPAAKLARREGIDFVLDPMWQSVRSDLFEHIDGLKSPRPNPAPRYPHAYAPLKTEAENSEDL